MNLNFKLQIKRIFKLLGIDLAVAFVLLGRGWGIVAGLVNVLLISKFLGSAEQGYFYTFSSIVALQIFFELGLSVVISQFASHEMANLTWSRAIGLSGTQEAKERIFSLIKFSVKWYGIIAPALFIVVAPLGIFFFSTGKPDFGPQIAWHSPWIALVLFSSINLFLSPIICVAEGIGLVADVAKMRLVQAVVGSCLLWSTLTLNLGLLSVAVMPATICLVSTLWIKNNFAVLVREALKTPTSEYKISWRREIFPMQWRIAISWLCGYLIFQLFTPIAFRFHSAEIAGQLGMSIAIATAMSTVAMSWVVTKMPTLGKLISSNKINEANQLHKRASLQSTAVIVVLALLLTLAVWLLPNIAPGLASRILPIRDFASLGVAAVANHIIFCQASYVRAFKTEKYLSHAVIMASAVVAVCGTLGVKGTVSWMLTGYAGIMSILGVATSFYIFYSFRRSLNLKIT